MVELIEASPYPCGLMRGADLARANAAFAQLDPPATRALAAEAMGAGEARTRDLRSGARTFRVTATPLRDGSVLVLAVDASEEVALREFVDLLIATVGHDLRNVLSAVATGTAVVLRRGALAEAQRTTLERVQSASERMARMVTQVLDVGRSRMPGGLPVHRDAMDLGELVAKVATASGDRLRAGAVRCVGTAHGAWDAERVADLVAHLVDNAVRHGDPQGEVLVRVDAVANGAEITVQNAGPPLSEEALRVVFDPARWPRARVKSKGGLGLGVHVADLCARAHGGDLTATSDASATVFRARLPSGTPGAS